MRAMREILSMKWEVRVLLENMEGNGGEGSKPARRGFLRKLVGAVMGAGIAGLLLGREGVKPAYAANTFPPDGKVGIGTTRPTDLLDVKGNAIRLRTSKTPASASDACSPGQICWD